MRTSKRTSKRKGGGNIAQSLAEQADYALHKITKFGESKHLMKMTKGRDEVEKWIFSISSLNKHKSNLRQILNFVEKKFGITRITDIKPKHTRAFIEQKKAEGYSSKTLKGYVSSLKKLEYAAPRAFKCAKRKFVNRNLELGTYEPGTTEVTKAFKPLEVAKMLDIGYKKDFRRGLAIETMARCGLRSGEMGNLKAGSIRLQGLSEEDLKELSSKCKNETDFKIYQKAGEGPCIFLRGKHDGAKNGRYRVVPIPKDMVEKFEHLLRSREPSDRFFGVKQRTIQRWVQEAREQIKSEVTEGKACHGLRKTFCQEFVNSRLTKFGLNIPKEEMDKVLREVSALMGHSRTEILKYYL